MYRDCRSCYRTYLLKSSNYHEQFCSLAVACAACKWKVPPLIPRRSIIFESLYTQGQGAYLRGIRVGTEKNIKIITSTEQEYHVDQVVNVLLTLSWISQVRFLLEAICIFSFYFWISNNNLIPPCLSSLLCFQKTLPHFFPHTLNSFVNWCASSSSLFRLLGSSSLLHPSAAPAASRV